MIYADTDFFLALMKPSDWLKESAMQLLEEYKGEIVTSSVTLIELLLLSKELKLDPERLILDVLEIADLRDAAPDPFLIAAGTIKEGKTGVFDALHAAFCGQDAIISSDKVFDKLGLKRVKLEGPRR
ncbi:MAG: PIN domain-containing protein [Planctomycetia bacterium]|nr:PIN domain-containing protein [Planctomycetia bacterium]